jgi:hypothetical protein
MKPPVPGASKPANEGGNLDDHAPDTLGSQVNISVFLGILILTVFIMPSIGFGAAIAIYLLFGLAWANAYLIAMQLKPNSFYSTVGLSSSYVSEWYYCVGMVLLQLRDSDYIGLWRYHPADFGCACSRRRRSSHRATLSRCLDCEIDRHGDQLLPTKNSLRALNSL